MRLKILCRAIVSGVLIGASFVFKKKGLLRSQAGGEAGEGVAYLKSVCRELAYSTIACANSVPLGALVDRDD